METRIFASPSRYVQGKGVLKTGLNHIKKLGDRALLLCDDFVYSMTGKELEGNLNKAGIAVKRIAFNGEASMAEIGRVAAIGKQEGSNVILGLGGGKTVDSAKGIADELGVPVCILPTLASTDAPCSALSVIYTEKGAFEKYLFYKKNPDLVMVDTEVICHAPTRMLASGIADALATNVEVKAVQQKNGTTMAGGVQSLASIAIAEKCESTLFTYAMQAMEANRAQVVTSALEAVVEANTLLSGIGFESGGLAAAHAIHNGFTALVGDIHHMTHGEKVAYGTLTQFFLQNEPKDTIDKFIKFYQALGLPTTLAELHLDANDMESLLKVGRQSTIEGETMHEMPFEITAEDVAAALKAADTYVNTYFPVKK
jgi:glycerol dehydrogenase